MSAGHVVGLGNFSIGALMQVQNKRYSYILYLIDNIAHGFHLWYPISIFKNMCRKLMANHPGIATGLTIVFWTPRSHLRQRPITPSEQDQHKGLLSPWTLWMQFIGPSVRPSVRLPVRPSVHSDPTWSDCGPGSWAHGTHRIRNDILLIVCRQNPTFQHAYKSDWRAAFANKWRYSHQTYLPGKCRSKWFHERQQKQKKRGT
jgi:hypothetical protein